MAGRDLEAPPGWQSEVRNYRWQNFFKMVQVNRLEEISCGRKLESSPYIPACRVSLRRVAKAVDGLLSQGRQSQAELQMRLARVKLNAEALT